MKMTRNIKELAIVPEARIFVAPRKTPDVVTVEGSVHTALWDLPKDKSVVPHLLSELLDAGTKRRTKEEIRGTLSEKGATLSFYVCGSRLAFSGSCLPEDLALLLEILAECLGQPSFPAAEIEAARERMRGSLTEEKTETRTQALGALLRALYEPDHPNYLHTTDARMRSLKSITRAELVSFAKSLGRGGLVLAVSGDVTEETVSRAVRPLAKLSKGTPTLPRAPRVAKKAEKREILVPIKDKANIDTFIGAPVPLTYNHPLYVPFMFLSDMLGSRGFSGHLMQTIRERDGLTYGIYSMPGFFDDGVEGLFRIWATFSPGSFKQAVEATFKEVDLFFRSGLKEGKIAERAERLVGAYLVGLSTTGGLASALHRIGKEGKPLSYLDEYPELLRKVSLSDLRAAAALIPRDSLLLTAAGSFEK